MIYNILAAIALIAADQGFKYLATLYLQGGTPVTVIPHILGLTFTLNPGAAFSLFSGKVNMLIIITTVALAAIAYFIFVKKINNKIENFCFLLIFAGGVGNLIDRVLAGMVVDYLEFLFINFPIFNFADCLVCCGVGIYAIYTIYTEFALQKKKGKL